MYNIGLYLRRNLGKVFFLSLVLSLAVSGTLVISAVIGSIGDTRVKLLGVNEYWIEIFPNHPLDTSVLTNIIDHVEVLPVDLRVLGYPMLGTANAGFKVYGFESGVVLDIAEKLNVSLIEGRFPMEPSEVTLPDSLLKARGLKVGDILQERGRFFSQGDYKVVGRLTGDVLAGFVFPSTASHDYVVMGSDLFFLEEQIRHILAGQQVPVYGPSLIRSVLAENYREYLGISAGISIVLAIIFSLVLWMLNSVESKNRRSEIALLTALGYPKGRLYLTTFVDLCIKMVSGWLVGVLFSYALVRIFEVTLFEPKGMFLSLTSSQVWPTLLIPFLVSVISFCSLIKTFKGDPLRMLDSFAAERGDVS